MKSTLIDLTGQRFGKLKVVKRSKNSKSGKARWKCRCTCGQYVVVSSCHLRNKNNPTKSCGCLRFENKTHGMHGTRTYRSWDHMIQRCQNKKYKRYYDYGGRGIQVCKRWKKFQNFLNDMGKRPKGKTLDRIDNNGNYEKQNCKWSTPHEQQMNRRNNKKRPNKLRVYLSGDGVRAAPEFVLPEESPHILLTYWDQKDRLTERFRQLRKKAKGKRVFFPAKDRTESLRQKRKNPKVNSGVKKK